MVLHATELEAYKLRDEYGDDSTLLKTPLINSGFEGIDIIKTSQFANPSSPYTIACKGTIDIETIGGLRVIRPLIGFHQTKELINYTINLEQPFDYLYPKSESYDVVIELPQNAHIVKLPDDLTISNQLLDASLQIKPGQEKISIAADLYLKEAKYESPNLAELKTLLSRVLEHFSHEIVLSID